MRLTVRTAADAAVIDVEGRLVGRAAADVLGMHVRRSAARGHVVVVNLACAAAMDIDALTALLAAARDIGRGCRGVRLAGVATTLSDLVVVVRLLTAFETFDSVEQALGVSCGRVRARCRFLTGQPATCAWTGVASAAGVRPS